MKNLMNMISRIIAGIREWRRQRAPETAQMTDNYMLLGSILGGYCGSLSAGRRDGKANRPA